VAELQTTHSQRIIIEPSKGWASLKLRELWEYRDLLYFMIWRDLKARYRQTALGPIWIVLQPLMSMFLYTMIFGVIANLPSEGKPYAVFSYVALLPWGFFTDAFSNGVNGLHTGINLSSKVYFPRLIIPLANIIASLVDLSISFVILAGMIIFYGIQPTWGIVFLPLFLLLAAVTGLGFGLLFSGLMVKYRDVGQFSGYLVRSWMYLTPVVYSIEIVPEEWLTLYRLNPMTNVIEGFRWALLGTGQEPNWLLMGVSGLLSLIVLFIGMHIFKRAERTIVDVA
jgi:lipopolysaccharide transport system permease protein